LDSTAALAVAKGEFNLRRLPIHSVTSHLPGSPKRCGYRLHALRAPVPVNRQALRRQFGEAYGEPRFFRRNALPNLKLALAVYPSPPPEAGAVGTKERRESLTKPCPRLCRLLIPPLSSSTGLIDVDGIILPKAG
jgi:hypothetical protein